MSKKEQRAKQKLVDMLKYMRPEGDVYQDIFNNRFLKPLMGNPDEYGNYICMVDTFGNVIQNEQDFKTENSQIAFMAHHDTVHKQGGIQNLKLTKAVYSAGPYKDQKFECVESDSNCLGADCTTGCWLILEMIKAKVPGIYIIHAGEEVGGIGSSSLVASKPEWLKSVEIAISFDRKGKSDIITHQWGGRCCSDEFAKELGKIIGLGMIPDSTGSYTDSAEYVYDVPECTNISVGYFAQHTQNEFQDLTFAMKLRKALIEADWNTLSIYKDVEDRSYSPINVNNPDYWDNYYSNFDNKGVTTTVRSLVEEYPGYVADILMQYGYDYQKLRKEIMSYGELIDDGAIPF